MTPGGSSADSKERDHWTDNLTAAHAVADGVTLADTTRVHPDWVWFDPELSGRWTKRVILQVQIWVNPTAVAERLGGTPRAHQGNVLRFLEVQQASR